MTQPRRFGAYEILPLFDGVFEHSSDALIHADGAEARERTIAAWGDPNFRFDVNCFLLRGPDGLTLIDSGCGSAWGAAFGHARAALRDAGVAPDDIKRVLLTHIHGDHALGLFERDEPYFPRAEIWVAQDDLDFYTSAEAREKTPEARRTAFKLTEQLLKIYGDRVRGIPMGAILPGVEAMSLPGHTPAHTGYLIGEGGDRLLIWGDALHFGDFQAADPKRGLSFDIDPTTAVRTRFSMLDRAARENWVITGSHLKGSGRIERAGEGFHIAAA
ncbi:AidB family quorum-quenching N-acyl homoserine lactonase [Terrarubrum flagellatum]|uniref:AidB family quorum-quenching N-acyl homoserine lactonase n=1 Tax=Terrirubrum flagellatum TaxID=2895980 RepID=UPI00314563A1